MMPRWVRGVLALGGCRMTAFALATEQSLNLRKKIDSCGGNSDSRTKYASSTNKGEGLTAFVAYVTINYATSSSCSYIYTAAFFASCWSH